MGVWAGSHDGGEGGRPTRGAGKGYLAVRRRFTVSQSARRSDDDGKFQIDLPPGEYEVRSDKLPSFAATKRDLSVVINQTVEVTIVPAVSSEGVLCSLLVTSGPTKKPKRCKRHR